MNTTTLNHRVIFEKTSPEQVYRAFMDEGRHAAFTGLDARIEAREGGWFVTCGGRNFGFTLKLVPHHRIIQAWTHRDFPNGQYSVIDLELMPWEDGCRLNFHHLAVPADCVDWLNTGWQTTYWRPMQRWLQENAVLKT